MPKNLSRNFKGKKIDITFDEYFKLSNEYQEITISPETGIAPTFKVKKKTLEIDFKDSLENNTTYSIHFGKAIQDVNESNILKNFSFVFATGPKLDSLQISGKVISSQDNQPVLDATVFLFPLKKDSLFGKKKPSIYTSTDSSGNFSLKNLREDTYRIYALKETGADRIYNSPNEDIAFLKDSIFLNKDTSNISLKLFKQVAENFRILDRRIEKDGKINLYFNKPLEKPSITFIDAPTIKNPIIDFSSKGDTVHLWLRDYSFDSLKVAINNYDKVLDTVTLRRSLKDTYNRTILFNNNLSGGKIVPGKPLTLTFNLPISSINASKVVLTEDSISKSGFTIKKLLPSELKYQIDFPWKTKKRYTLSFNEGAIEDIYGTKNKDLKLDFELDEIENYGNLSLNLIKEDSLKNYIVQLLVGKENNIYKEFVITKNATVNINNIPTNTYKVRVIEDANNNGKFDSGNVRLKIQPEKVWFWDKTIVTRANWDREEKIAIPKDFKD
ncbi:Ig-like domain-containing protein [Pedobacter sp. SD-b]|uniref:Ig-like domain-containing protein n=2 Tax=Pedobacter segetis TaxID=2793069 RepID=A0ABS1BEZ6_9SPHI|nr:Ig-like domain-containing protein [Pedobacter segetis]